MKKLCWSIIISLLFCHLQAQKLNFEQKKIGILISRKNLTIDNYQAKFWASYLQLQDSLGLTDESLKTAVSIKIGQMLTVWLKKYFLASEVYFLNEGNQFENVVKSYPFQNPPNLSIPLDFILCIDQLQLLSDKEKVVFTISNKIYSETKTQMTLNSKILVYQIEPFQLVKMQNYSLNENNLLNKPIPTQNFSLKIEKFMGSWLNYFFQL